MSTATGNGFQEVDEWHAPYNPWITAVVSTLASFMVVLDTSIANVALPHIAGNLSAGVEDSTWVLTSYLVASTVVLPATAWISALIGRANFYFLSIILFTAGSLLCGMAPSLGMLVFFRILQGLGGGGLLPTTQAILVDTFPLRQRGMGMAVFGMTVVAAPVIGPTLGGWITDNYSWRWIFLINVPVGAISLFLGSKFISDPPFLVRRKGPDRFKVDWLGLVLMALALGTLQVALDLGQRRDWLASSLIVTCFATCAISAIAAVVWELKYRDPVLDLKLLGDRNFGLASLSMLIFGAVLFGSTLLLPLFTQTLLGYTAMLSGLAVSPGGLMIMVMMPVVGWMVSRFDARALILVGIAVLSYSLFVMSHFNLETDFRTVVAARLVQGFGLGFIFVPLNTVAYAYVARESRNAASSLINIARNVGGGIGIAFVSTMISRGSQVHQTYLVSHLTPFDAAYTEAIRKFTPMVAAQVADPASVPSVVYSLVYKMLSGQAAMLAFADEFRALSYWFLTLIPLVLLMKRPASTNHVEIPAE